MYSIPNFPYLTRPLKERIDLLVDPAPSVPYVASELMDIAKGCGARVVFRAYYDTLDFGVEFNEVSSGHIFTGEGKSREDAVDKCMKDIIAYVQKSNGRGGI